MVKPFEVIMCIYCSVNKSVQKLSTVRFNVITEYLLLLKATAPTMPRTRF